MNEVLSRLIALLLIVQLLPNVLLRHIIKHEPALVHLQLPQRVHDPNLAVPLDVVALYGHGAQPRLDVREHVRVDGPGNLAYDHAAPETLGLGDVLDDRLAEGVVVDVADGLEDVCAAGIDVRHDGEGPVLFPFGTVAIEFVLENEDGVFLSLFLRHRLSNTEGSARIGWLIVKTRKSFESERPNE